MTLGFILEQAGIPLLLFVICMYYGIRLLVSQDASLIRSKDKDPVKDEKAYARESGKIFLFFAGSTLIMALLIFVNLYLALGEIVICTLIMGILWKSMNNKYGI